MDVDREAMAHLCHGAVGVFRQRGVIPKHFLDDQALRAAEEYFACLDRGIELTPADLRQRTNYQVGGVPETSPESVCDQLLERFKHYTTKQVVRKLERALVEGNADQVIQEMEQGLARFYSEGMGEAEIVNLLDLGGEVLKRFERAKEGYIGIRTPWETLSEATRGYQEDDLWIVAARTGVGKTMVLVLMALLAWEEGYTPLLVITEMGAVRMAERFFGAALKISPEKIDSGDLTGFEETELRSGLERLKKAKPLRALGGGMFCTIGSLSNALIAVKPDVVFVDGLYLVAGEGKSRHEIVSNVVNHLKALAKIHHTPIIASTQLNRGEKGKEDDPEKVTEERIGISDVIGWGADVILALFQTKDMIEDNEMLCRLLKVRAGGKRNYKIAWDFDRMSFGEIRENNEIMSTRAPTSKQMNLDDYEDELTV